MKKLTLTDKEMEYLVSIIEDGFAIDIEGGGDTDLEEDENLEYRKKAYKAVKKAFDKQGIILGYKC